MACVSLASMLVIINGKPTNFFKMGRGFRQILALYPLLFILIVVDFSRGLQAMKERGDIKGWRISRNS